MRQTKSRVTAAALMLAATGVLSGCGMLDSSSEESASTPAGSSQASEPGG